MSTSDINLDDILQKLGPFGRYNVVNYALLLFPIYLAGMYGSVFVFEAPDISYRCRISECENINHSYWLEHAIPKENGVMSKCKRFQFRDNITDVCNKSDFDTSVQEECSEYVYSDEDSAVKDFDLGCDWRRTLIGSIHNAGLFIALPLTGFISDKYGRKIALALATLMNGVFGVLRSFSTSYVMMLIFEFLETALGGGVNSTAFVFAMELVHPKGRVLGNLILNSVAVLGGGTLALLAWKLQNWRVLIRVIYAPAILAISYIWIMNESVRWLISKGRNDEAKEILKKAARMNKVDISDETMTPLNTIAKIEENQESTPPPQNTETEKRMSYVLVKALKSNIIRTRVIICSVLWITCTFVYYGLAINSVSLGGNQYVNFALVALVEIPSTLIGLVVLEKFGRKRVLIATYLLSGCLCIGLSFIPKDPKWVVLLIYILGKCAITIAYFSVYIYVSEVFPTSVRQSLLAVCSSFGRFGSTLAPLTPLLPMKSVIFGSLALAATLLVLLLPETKNMTLPNTIEEAERITQKTRRKSTETAE